MSVRFCQDYVLRGTPEDCFAAISQLLTARKFNYTTQDGEQVFQHGTGWVAAPTFVKITFGQGTVRVETWMRYAILPGVYGAELGMDGFVGCAVKGVMKEAATAIDMLLGGSAARIGCDPFLVGKNDTGAPQPLPGYAPAQLPQYAVPQPQYAPQPQYVAPQQPQYAPQPQYQAPQPQYAPQYAPQPQTGFCRNCGMSLAPGTSFCPNCGARN